MIVLDMEQGSMEWTQARLGIPTASRFSDILTPKKLTYSASADRYMRELLAEWVLGYPVEEWSSAWAERGESLEPEARRAYAFERGLTVETVGFVLRDDRLVGCSPDGFAGEGGLELKCPSAKVHLGYLLDHDSLVEEYKLQIHGGLWLTERPWWDVMSYHPGLPPVLVRVAPDAEILKALDDALANFLAVMQTKRVKLREMGIAPRLEELEEAA